MIQRFCEVFVWTADMARAIEFWRDVVGLELVEAGSQWSTFRVADSDPAHAPIFGVMSTGGDAVPWQPSGVNGVQQGAVFTFQVPNLIEAISRYEDRGLCVMGSMYDDPAWGRCVMYQDFDRNTFMIVERYPSTEEAGA